MFNWIVRYSLHNRLFVMAFAAKPLADFIETHPTMKMLALAFILLVGLALVADGLRA